MSLYNSLDLFGSGPHEFIIHGLKQRHVVHEQPGADGVAVTSLGQSGRRIDQTGTLVADSLTLLEGQISQINQAMDGNEYDLVDDLGRSFSNVMMTSFAPGRIKRIGTRTAVDYQIQYIQSQI